MEYGKLSKYFTSFAAKQLSVVETDPKVSNQHEFNGVKAFLDILGRDKISHADTSFLYFSDDEDFTFCCDGFLTWYDAREKHPTRTEYRMYFPSNDVMIAAAENDLMVLGIRPEGNMLVIIAKAGSTRESQLRVLFDLGHEQVQGVISKILVDESDSNLTFITSTILDGIGVSTDKIFYDSDLLELIFEKFPQEKHPKLFPSTRDFSAFARHLVGKECSSVDDPDEALLKWLEMEERLFRTLEWHDVSTKLEKGFGGDVDDFISFSLSVQNRRKSRAGASFENHLEQIFIDNKVKYVRGATTENKSKPDFLFPGIEEYQDSNFPESKLYMLGAKTTCKDRWRQILSEAKRIEGKHLATLEPAISENQTDEMQAHNIQLVIPESIQSTFTGNQRKNIITINLFIKMLDIIPQL